MLNEYYFLGFGNFFDGYTIFANSDLELNTELQPYYLTPTYTSDSRDMSISVYPFKGRTAYNFFQFQFRTDPNEPYISGRFNEITKYTSGVLFDVNSNFNISDYTGITRNYYKNDMFVLSSTLGLIRTTNQIVSEHSLRWPTTTEDLNDFNIDSTYNVRVPHIVDDYRLLIDPDYFDLECTHSYSNNIYEYLDQFSVSLYDAIMDENIWRPWKTSNIGNNRIRYPISNYGTEIEEVEGLYMLKNINKVENDFFGISSTVWQYDPILYNEKFYQCLDINSRTFTKPTYSVYSDYDSLLSGFSFKVKKYLLKKVGQTDVRSYFSALYKNENYYYPLEKSNSYYESSNIINGNIGVSVTDLGKWKIVNQDYMEKQNSFKYVASNYIHYGTWASGLQYIPDDYTNVSGNNLTILEAPLSANYFWQPNILGVHGFGDKYDIGTIDNYPYYITKYVTDKIITNGQTVYVAIDPQSYTISL